MQLQLQLPILYVPTYHYVSNTRAATSNQNGTTASYCLPCKCSNFITTTTNNINFTTTYPATKTKRIWASNRPSERTSPDSTNSSHWVCSPSYHLGVVLETYPLVVLFPPQLPSLLLLPLQGKHFILQLTNLGSATPAKKKDDEMADDEKPSIKDLNDVTKIAGVDIRVSFKLNCVTAPRYGSITSIRLLFIYVGQYFFSLNIREMP